MKRLAASSAQGFCQRRRKLRVNEEKQKLIPLQ
jgi:hypothetical protein